MRDADKFFGAKAVLRERYDRGFETFPRSPFIPIALLDLPFDEYAKDSSWPANPPAAGTVLTTPAS